MPKRLPLVLSATALAVALLGSTPLGEAAQQLVPKASVGTVHLKTAAVTTSKLKNNSVTGPKVKKGTLRATHFGPGQLPAGPAGPPGPKGDQGVKGDPGVSGHDVIGGSSPLNTTSQKEAFATCPAGMKVLGGGGYVTNVGGTASLNDLALIQSWPTPSETAWLVRGVEVNPTGGTWRVTALAICGKVAP